MAKQLIKIAQPLNQKLTSTRLQNLIHRNHHQRQKHHHQLHNDQIYNFIIIPPAITSTVTSYYRTEICTCRTERP